MKHIVVDLEINSFGRHDPIIDGLKGEIIEIGAVMLDDSMHEVAEYKTYVYPEYKNKISPQIEKLTGITEEHVKNAPKFNDAFETFSRWCLDAGDEIILYEWSTADRNQLYNECLAKNIELTLSQKQVMDAKWVDIQAVFDRNAGFERQISLNIALYATGLMVEGELHDALDDARNTSRILAMMNDADAFADAQDKIHAYMNPPPLTTPMGALFDFSVLGLPSE